MPDVTIIPTGIAALDHNCWELVHRDTGRTVDLDGDGDRHFDSQAEAESWGETLDGFRMHARELPEPCWVATAICGWRLDDELPMVMHHATANEALKAALDCEMKAVPAGLICSPDCDGCKQDEMVTAPSPTGGEPC